MDLTVGGKYRWVWHGPNGEVMGTMHTKPKTIDDCCARPDVDQREQIDADRR